MKMLKRTISTMLMTVLLCACFSVSALAASAELRFSDPETTVGAEVTVTVSFTSDSSIQSMGATLSYDDTMLRFIEGGSAKASDGKITMTGAGDGMSTQIIQELTFQALQEGTTMIEVESSEGVTTSGSDIYVTDGNSTIVIGPGDPSLIKPATTSNVKIEVNGTMYAVSGDFSEALIPEGFVANETQFEGELCQVVTQESGGMMAMYLVAEGEEDGEFFLYDSTNGQFTPFEQVEIASDRYIILLQNTEDIDIPSGYSQTTIMIENSGNEFPAWQNIDDPEYYLVYGLNSDGNKELYLYDTVDGTYQRFLKGEVVEPVEEEKLPEGILGEILKFVGDNLMLCLLVVAAAILFLILILIVVAIKLRHRNLEIDDLYDEYGIDEDEEEEDEDEEDEEPVKAKKEKKGLFGKKKSKEEFDDFDDDDFDDDEDDFDEDDFDEDDDDEDDFGFNDDDDDIDDLDELLNARNKKSASRSSVSAKTAVRPAQKPAVKPAAPRKAAPQPVAPKVGKPQQRLGHSDFDDTFKMDLIDLD